MAPVPLNGLSLSQIERAGIDSDPLCFVGNLSPRKTSDFAPSAPVSRSPRAWFARSSPLSASRQPLLLHFHRSRQLHAFLSQRQNAVADAPNLDRVRHPAKRGGSSPEVGGLCVPRCGFAELSGGSGCRSSSAGFS